MKLTTIDKQLIEKLFQMEGGYVLDFSDRTIEEFFRDDLAIEIYDEKYNYASGSKANRIRGFFKNSTNEEKYKVIIGLIEYIKSKIIIGDFEKKDFPDERINMVEKIAQKLVSSNNENFYNNFNSDLQGTETFKYENNNGLYVIGDKDALFGIKFSGAGSDSVYIYNDDESIDCIAKIENIDSVEKINYKKNYDGTSRVRQVYINEIVLLKNIYRRYACIKIKSIDLRKHGDVENSVTFEYKVFPKDTIFKIAGEKKVKTDAYVDKDSIQIIPNQEVFGHVKSLLDSGHYYNAVEESYKIVRQKLREKTGKEKAHEAFSQENMLKIFSTEAQSDTEKDFREGVKFLHMSIQNLRNEKAHTPAKEIDKNLALHYIVMAGLAYDLLV